MGLLSPAGAMGSAGGGVRGAALSLRDLPGVARAAAGVLGGGADGSRVGDRDSAWDGRGRPWVSAGRGAVGGARDDGARMAAAAARTGRRAAGAVRAPGAAAGGAAGTLAAASPGMPRACRPARGAPSRPSVVSAATNLAARREWSSRSAKRMALPAGRRTRRGRGHAAHRQSTARWGCGLKAPEHPGRAGRDLPAHADSGEVTLDRPGRRRAGPVDAGGDPRDLRARPGRLLAPQRDGLLQQHGRGPPGPPRAERASARQSRRPDTRAPIDPQSSATARAAAHRGARASRRRAAHDHAALTARQSLVDRVADHAIAPQRLGLTPVCITGHPPHSGWGSRPPSRPRPASVRARPCWPATTRRSLREKRPHALADRRPEPLSRHPVRGRYHVQQPREDPAFTSTTAPRFRRGSWLAYARSWASG